MAKRATTITAPPPRPTRLPVEFELQSPDDVDAALKELAWCNSRTRSIDAEFRELHNAIEAKRAPCLALKIGGRQTTLLDRAADLEQAIKAWSQDRLKDHLTGDERTLKLDHGSISYRKLPLAVVVQEGLDDDTVIERVEKLVSTKHSSLIARARAICGRVLIKATKLILGDLITVRVGLNLQGATAAHKAGRLDAATLKKLGLVAVDDKERFSFEVA